MKDHIATCSRSNDCTGNSSTRSADPREASDLHNSSGTKANKKKMKRSYYPHNPALAFPTYQSNHAPAAGQFYPPWVPQGSYPNGAHMWGSPYYPGWKPSQTWHWKPHPGLYADVWGCPVISPSSGSCPPYPQNASGLHRAVGIQNRYNILEKSVDIHPECWPIVKGALKEHGIACELS